MAGFVNELYAGPFELDPGGVNGERLGGRERATPLLVTTAAVEVGFALGAAVVGNGVTGYCHHWPSTHAAG